MMQGEEREDKTRLSQVKRRKNKEKIIEEKRKEP